MYIIHLTSELAPIAKVGGLGDVAAGLSKALIQEGEVVEVILPFYDHIDRSKLKNLKVDCENLSTHLDGKECLSTVWSAEVDGISTFLIEPHDNKGFFKKGSIYGDKEDDIQFMFFSRAALEYLLRTKKHPDALNLHDWLTGFAAPLYYEEYQSRGLQVGTIVTTIHNMKYQGVCHPDNLIRLGIDPTPFDSKDKLQDLYAEGQFNLLKGALIYSDVLTTVSPNYSEEIKGEEGFGLGQLVQKYSGKLVGILNGIDMDYWNPATDPVLPQNYSNTFSSLEEIKKAKMENRKAINHLLSKRYDSRPFFTCITRLVQQKGPELIRFGVEYALKKGGQFLLLGSTPQEGIKDEFYSLAEEYRENPHAHFHFVFDENLAHLCYAAADCILIPSLFEPCGLTQMIASRYGTIPIVHKVGGLKDTIFDIDNEEISLNKRNGYTFDDATVESLQSSMDRTFHHLEHSPEKWKVMQKNGLESDWSWRVSALKYLQIYQNSSESSALILKKSTSYLDEQEAVLGEG